MHNLNITPGPFTLLYPSANKLEWPDEFSIVDKFNCLVAKLPVQNFSLERAETHAKIGLEAFQVTKECGYTPRQLLEQRDKLIAVVNKVVNTYYDIDDPEEQGFISNFINELRDAAAIQNAGVSS